MGQIGKLANIKFVVAIGILAFASACGQMNSSITSSSTAPAVTAQNRIDPDFIPGEIVTTGSGHEVRAVIGDIAEKVTTSSGHTIEAVFYQ